MKNYLDINKSSWNNRLESHLKSDFYDMKGFLDGNSTLNEIELALLGDLKGKKILHLQCHFGQDTISLSKLGAEVTGIDLSDLAIKKAKYLAKETKSSAKFICCDVYDLPQHLDEKFDLIYTSYGVISWMPDLIKWADIVQQFLKPQGKFLLVEFHPIIWMYDDDFNEVRYYYNNKEAIVETEEGTYADKNANIKQQYVCWNHGLGEVMNSLISNKLRIDDIQEYDYSPYNCVNQMVEISTKKFRISKFGDKVPLVYSIMATKD